MILIRNSYTPQQVKLAETKAAEFKPTRYTSGCANLDNMVALKKCVLLCVVHNRKFNPVAARYKLHPNKKLRRVFGRCDVCQEDGLSFLYLNEVDAEAEHRKIELFNRSIEYSRHLNG